MARFLQGCVVYLLVWFIVDVIARLGIELLCPSDTQSRGPFDWRMLLASLVAAAVALSVYELIFRRKKRIAK